MVLAPVTRTYGSIEADITLIFVSFENRKVPPFLHALALNTSVPVVGQRAVATSFFKGSMTPQSSTAGETRTYRYIFDYRYGTVNEVSHQGSRGLKTPCFSTTIPFDAGMSGGPVLVGQERGKVLAASGVICRDFSEPVSFSDGSPGLSTAAQLWPALALGFKWTINGVPEGRLSLLDCIKRGFVVDVGNSPAKVEVLHVEGDEYKVKRLDGRM